MNIHVPSMGLANDVMWQAGLLNALYLQISTGWANWNPRTNSRLIIGETDFATDLGALILSAAEKEIVCELFCSTMLHFELIRQSWFWPVIFQLELIS